MANVLAPGLCSFSNQVSSRFFRSAGRIPVPVALMWPWLWLSQSNHEPWNLT